MRDTAFQGICQLTENFLTAISHVQAAIASNSGDRTASQSVFQSVSRLQQQYQEIIATFESIRIDPQVEQRIRPFLTEGHRRLRLAGVEAMRLQAAKQTATVEKQRSLITAHLDQLQKFAQAIADEVCSNP